MLGRIDDVTRNPLLLRLRHGREPEHRHEHRSGQQSASHPRSTHMCGHGTSEGEKGGR